MVITDRFDHLIDDKNRLAIPSSIRNAMDPDVDGSAFYLVPKGNYLQLIPEKLFERLSNQSTVGLTMTPEVAKARRLIFATASRLEPDKQGRVIIPDRFMVDSKNRDPFTQAVMGHEVTLVGANDRIELWNRQDFLKHMQELLSNQELLESSVQLLFGKPPATGTSPN